MKCQVGWNSNSSGPFAEPCLNPATHRAISTSGRNLTIFQVCERCAMLAAPLRYEKEHIGGMKAGDPLWLFYPPLTNEQGTANVDDAASSGTPEVTK